MPAMHAALPSAATVVPATEVRIEPCIDMPVEPLTPRVRAAAATSKPRPAAVAQNAALGTRGSVGSTPSSSCSTRCSKNPVAGVPARNVMNRPFISDHKLLQREQKTAATWLWAMAYAVILSLAFGFLCLLAWGLHRVAVSGKLAAGQIPVA